MNEWPPEVMYLASLNGLCEVYPHEYRLFRPVVELIKPKVIVELGTETGISTHEIAKYMPSDARFVTVDIADRSKDVADIPCEVITGDSVEVGKKWEGPIDLLFVDTEHTYDQVLAELNEWAKWVQYCILLHDTGSYPEVHRAIMKFIEGKEEWLHDNYPPPMFGMGVMWRKNARDPNST